MRRVSAADGAEQQRHIVHCTAERPDLVQRRSKRYEAEARYRAVCRLEAHDTAQTGWAADGTAGIGAEGKRHLARSHTGRASAG